MFSTMKMRRFKIWSWKMSDNTTNQIARQLYAMSKKKKDVDIVDMLRNERYPRTMTDEYPWNRPSRKRNEPPITDEQRKSWEALARK